MANLRLKLGSLAAATALAVGSGVVVNAPTASASSCLSVLGGRTIPLTLHGSYIGVFYAGYDSCNHNIYAELNFASTFWTTQFKSYDKTTSAIYVTHSGSGWANALEPGINPQTTFWDSPAVGIYTAPTSQRIYTAEFDLFQGSNDVCSGAISWNFSNGSVYSEGSYCA